MHINALLERQNIYIFVYIIRMSWITMKIAYPYEYYANVDLKYKINA